jgi:hypothetical protein
MRLGGHSETHCVRTPIPPTSAGIVAFIIAHACAMESDHIAKTTS